MEGTHQLRQSITSLPKQMGVPMTRPIWKASASPATGRKQRSKDSNDIYSHFGRPRGRAG